MKDSHSSQRCPLCGAVHPLAARRCTICGAALRGQPTPPAALPPVTGRASQPASRPRYDPASGDDDLYAGDLPGQMWRALLVGGVLVALLIGIGIGIVASRLGNGGESDSKTEPLPSPTYGTDSAADGMATIPPTATARGEGAGESVTAMPPSTMALVTVTSAPPTPTITPTPGPCIQKAQEGDTVFGMAIRCGHADLSIVDVILEMNDMESPTELQLGQELQIPWPTPTPGGPPTETPVEGVSGAEVSQAATDMPVNEFGTPDQLATYQTSEPTLRPGQEWHVVQAGETIIDIAYNYNVSVETLSQINPQIPFLQCDFGSQYGGPNCSVMLIEGQRLRVPVPLSTATFTPRPEGPLTPTPTATATFNAPYLLSPANSTEFGADQMVTLRWGGTGSLSASECYLVRVRDLDSGEEYLAKANELSYVLPGEWQPSDDTRHTYEWTVSVTSLDETGRVLFEGYTTDPRRFFWEGR